MKAACALGMSGVKLPGIDPSTNENWTKGKLSARFAQLTADPARLDLPFQYAIENPKLRMQPLTPGLVNYLLDTIDRTTNPETLAKIKTPILMSIPSEDKVVSQDAIRVTAVKLPMSEIYEITGGLHDTMSERNAVRAPFMKKTLSFFAKN